MYSLCICVYSFMYSVYFEKCILGEDVFEAEGQEYKEYKEYKNTFVFWYFVLYSGEYTEYTNT